MTQDTNKKNDYPFRVFISHKFKGHGHAAKSLKQELENLSPKQLEIFVSSTLDPGSVWRPEILKEIESADLFVMLYLEQGFDMDWCLYEAGYFEREALKTGRKLICMTSKGLYLPGPLENRQQLEVTKEGIEDLLRAVYNDDVKPVRPDLFDRRQEETLDKLIKSLFILLGPVKREPLSPRLYIHFKGVNDLNEIMNGSLPESVWLEGESDALAALGVGPGKSITLKEFYEESESKQSLKRYMPHVANCIRRIIKRKADLWVIPPIRLLKDSLPKVLIPAYYEEGLDSTYMFAFIVYQPQPDYLAGEESSFSTLYNFLVVTYRFKKRIIDEWLEALMDLRSLSPNIKEDDLSRKFRNFGLAFGTVHLDALNRHLDSPRKIKKQFIKEEREILEKIINQEDGLWRAHMGRLDSGIENRDINTVVDSLCELKNLNKTMMILTLKRLHELSIEQGDE